MAGPLSGVRVVEFAGLGPGPFAAMWLADMGADVVRIDRPVPSEPFDIPYDVLARGRRSIICDLKAEQGRSEARALCVKADILIEGLRPGVMERLGLGPRDLMADNPGLIYGRMTGWGQTGPRAQTAGHDINYIALTGALHAIGPDETPLPPLNLLGDFGGGAMYLVAGLLAALIERGTSGKGQVVDAAITDGTAHLSAMIYSMQAAGMWQDRRAANPLDGGAPYYRTYRCADGAHIAIGPIEPQFHAAFYAGLNLDPPPRQHDARTWEAETARVAARIAEKSRADWLAIFEGSDACVAPVLSLSEAPEDAHNTARETFVARDGVTQPAPAPRLSRTPGSLDRSPPVSGADRKTILSDWGISDAASD
ncbi:CaiB/BaiF CoA transferase family protein [Pontivivens insulae]|uniref:Succinyl-CoA--L-malate CoA-transferase alpha subunit n=1 Tax=Pontivivens insulae TaxID=1639689 RepID=A0A2R8ABE5_9RHOB|nr:CaiB/BaiF CoA-transferase family protein [Pontivivens insulae]RED11281.1 alpha-methylacyl-CoA racemase [Pontivivens insulae]SPF29546.1 Succinyl-CoA--L-malate CoA-transferase alpha subunit [Pontivivens insulae]